MVDITALANPGIQGTDTIVQVRSTEIRRSIRLSNVIGLRGEYLMNATTKKNAM